MVLLDTCALIWLVGDPTRFSRSAHLAISNAAGAVFVSAISAWEIATKSSLGKLELPKPADRWYAEVLEHHGLEEIPISGAIAIASTSLPRLHNDPADRLLIATAIEHGLTLVTPDKHISQYTQVQTIW